MKRSAVGVEGTRQDQKKKKKRRAYLVGCWKV